MLRFDTLFDALTDGILVNDEAGNILYMNPAAKKMLEISAASMKTLNACELLCRRLFSSGLEPCAKRCPLRGTVRPEAGAVTFSGRHGPKSGFHWSDFHINRTEDWRHLRVRCMRAPGDLLGLGSEERRFTVIEDASAEMELAERKEGWRLMAAHDLRSPLTSVLAGLQLLQMLPPGAPLADRERRSMDVAVRSCQRMAELLDLFLAVAKLDEGRMPVDRRAVALAPLARKAAEEQAPLAEAKGVAIKVSGASGLTAWADPGLLARVLQNLLNNAVKFSPDKGRIEVSVAASEGRATLAVRDEGPGIPADDLPLIFDRFYQAKAHREGKLKGVGLGLTFCREAVKAMGGSVAAASRPGQGAEFTVRLPLASAGPASRV